MNYTLKIQELKRRIKSIYGEDKNSFFTEEEISKELRSHVAWEKLYINRWVVKSDIKFTLDLGYCEKPWSGDEPVFKTVDFPYKTILTY